MAEKSRKLTDIKVKKSRRHKQNDDRIERLMASYVSGFRNRMFSRIVG